MNQNEDNILTLKLSYLNQLFQLSADIKSQQRSFLS